MRNTSTPYNSTFRPYNSTLSYRSRPTLSLDAAFQDEQRSIQSYKSTQTPLQSCLQTTTPFELHLQEVYNGNVDVKEGLRFFESHGYYDVDEANTVAMFRQTFKMDTSFWEEGDSDEEMQMELMLMDQEEDMNVSTVEELPYTYHTRGSLVAQLKSKRSRNSLSSPSHQGRHKRSRFQMLDADGNEMDDEERLEMEKERRMKRRALELDEHDLQMLHHEQIVLSQVIPVIRTEKHRFKRYFYQALNDEQKSQQALLTNPPVEIISLPPYSGYLFLLNDSTPHILKRSWHKRWIYLDFNAGVMMLYKRSYWKAPRGVVDFRQISQIASMDETGLRIEFYEAKTMILRAKSKEELNIWLNLLEFAKKRVMDEVMATQETNSLPVTRKNPSLSLSYTINSRSNINSSQQRNTRDALLVLLRSESIRNHASQQMEIQSPHRLTLQATPSVLTA